MNIIFVGGVKFSLDVLQYILEKKWKISTIFTYDDKKKSNYSDGVFFENITKKYNIDHIKVENINDAKNVELIKKISPDLILVMGWSQILKSQILAIPKIGIIGSHPTELPKYRGRAPIPWTIIKGLKKSALTFFWMTEGTDDGDILDQRFFNISENDNATSIYETISLLGSKMLDENLSLIKNGIINRIEQNPDHFIEYWEKRTPEDGKINWNDKGLLIHNLIRASTRPYPGAYTFLKTKKLIIWKSKFLKNNLNSPGKILEISNDGIKIGTKEGIILVTEFSYDNKIYLNPTEIFSNSCENLVLGN